MGAILSKYVFPFVVLGLALCLLFYAVYNRGYEAADNRCQKEKLEIIVTKEQEKNEIMAQIRQKSPVERRKALSRYVIQ